MTTLSAGDVVFEGSIEKKSKHSNSYKKRSAAVTKDTFFVFKRANRYNSPLDKIPFAEIVSIQVPGENDQLLILRNNKNVDYFYRSVTIDRSKWIDMIIARNNEIAVIGSGDSDPSAPTPQAEVVSNEILEESDFSGVLFDIDKVNYNNAAMSANHTDSEMEVTTIENYDFQVLEEIDFFVLDLVKGYLRHLMAKHNHQQLALVPSPVSDICVLFFFIRKFDTRKLKRDVDFA